jgi:hypothetical protein
MRLNFQEPAFLNVELFTRIQSTIIVIAIALSGAFLSSFASERVQFKEDDIVAFIGGADVATAQQTGYLESLLAIAHPTVRFRNFGWEGDTVFAQPRDFNFPPLPEHIRKAGATVLFVQFGRMEAFGENTRQFRAAYEKLLDALAQITPRLALVTPVPFERPPAPLPDVSRRNSDLEKISATIREVAQERKLAVLDLFSALKDHAHPFTDDGVQLTMKGHGIVAQAFARELGLDIKSPPELTDSGAWQDSRFEALRQSIITKNRLWFNYWRPQNWAFLGGDRTEQPSSRDHRDPKIRWFPEEMQKFQPLIAEKEKEITALARDIAHK